MESIRVVFLFMAHMIFFSMFAWRSKPNTKGEKEKSFHASKAFTGLQMFFFLRPIFQGFCKFWRRIFCELGDATHHKGWPVAMGSRVLSCMRLGA